jgi:hypothetical protein
LIWIKITALWTTTLGYLRACKGGWIATRSYKWSWTTFCITTSITIRTLILSRQEDATLCLTLTSSCFA